MPTHTLFHLTDVEVHLMHPLTRELDLTDELTLDFVGVAFVSGIPKQQFGGGLQHRRPRFLILVILVIFL